MEEWSPDDGETLAVRTLFELNARILEIQADVRAIRLLLEEDEDEDGEEEEDGED